MQLPRQPRRNPLISILELEDPKFSTAFHLMSRLHAAPMSPLLSPQMQQQQQSSSMESSPEAIVAELQRQLAQAALDDVKEIRAASEGYLLKNLEKDGKVGREFGKVLNRDGGTVDEAETGASRRRNWHVRARFA